MRVVGLVAIATLCCAFLRPTNAATPPAHRVAADHVTVELVTETKTLQPGSRAWVGMVFRHEPHWHTYWMNPGDSGLPTRLEWQLPTGFRAGDMAWPAPQRFDLGGLYNFGYDGTILLPIPIDVPIDAQPNTTVALNVNAKWLICNDVCIPGKASLRVDVPVSRERAVLDQTSSRLFADARANKPANAAWQGRAQLKGHRVLIELQGAGLPSATGLDVFATQPKLVSNAPMKIARRGDALIVDAEQSEYFESAPATLTLVLTQPPVGRDTARSWQVQVPWLGNASTKTPVK